MLAAAAAPEGHRGEPVAGAHARAARAHGRGGRGCRASRRLSQCRDDRVPRRGDGRRRALLLPGDEHATAGRAPGDRGGDGTGPGACAAPRRGGRAAPVDTGVGDAQRGHALECRVYAEDPAQRVPAAGGPARCSTGSRGRPACASTAASPRVATVSVHYDPMLAKVIVHAETRTAAIAPRDRGAP